MQLNLTPQAVHRWIIQLDNNPCENCGCAVSLEQDGTIDQDGYAVEWFVMCKSCHMCGAVGDNPEIALVNWQELRCALLHMNE